MCGAGVYACVFNKHIYFFLDKLLAHSYLNEGAMAAKEYLASEGFEMDELSTNVGIVATKNGKAYVGFRGAQSQAENRQ